MSDERSTSGKGAATARTIMGIIMIIIYVGMGVLILCNVFPWISGSWEWLKWAAGILLIVYGLWRAYRQFSGIDTSV